VKGVLVFDMDGVLVDVTESYREAIRATVAHFTGLDISHTRIQDYKNEGGWNDDWALSHHIITGAGVAVTHEAVVDHFQKLFHGDGTNGLILRERWIARDGLFARLSERFQCVVFTGRLRWEAEVTLNRFASAESFSPIIGSGDVARLKPAPDGLLRIRELTGAERQLWYVGDTVDDARSARAAGVPFIGIAAPSNPRYGELVELLRGEEAVAVLDDINQIESVIGL
jgi:HAD superfamily phosphatase